MADRKLYLLPDDVLVVIAPRGQTLVTGMNTAKTSLRITASTPTIPTPDPTPDPGPPPSPGQFRLGVGLIQGNWSADAARLKDKPGLVGAVHMVSFGGNGTGSDADSRVKWFDKSVDVMLHAALAPSDLSVSGKAYDANTRLRGTTEARTFADRVAAVVNANPNVKWVTFTNEWKGYYTSGTPNSWDAPTFVAHYIAFAAELRAKTTRRVDILGPYTTPTASVLTYCHQSFIDGVLKPHPELVDGICWDDGNGQKHKQYTDFYAARGYGSLPHWDVETYPGGWNVNPAPSDATVLAEMKAISQNPVMAGVLIWGPGPRPDTNNSESSQKALLWPSNQVATSLWKALIAQDYSR